MNQDDSVPDSGIATIFGRNGSSIAVVLDFIGTLNTTSSIAGLSGRLLPIALNILNWTHASAESAFLLVNGE